MREILGPDNNPTYEYISYVKCKQKRDGYEHETGFSTCNLLSLAY